MQEPRFQCPDCKHFTESSAFRRECAECDHPFHLLDDFGACPRCRMVHSAHMCQECGQISKLEQWWVKDSARNRYNLFHGLAKIREAAGKLMRSRKRRTQVPKGLVNPIELLGEKAETESKVTRTKRRLSVIVARKVKDKMVEQEYVLKALPVLKALLPGIQKDEEALRHGHMEWHMSASQMEELYGEMKKKLQIARKIKRAGADENLMIWSCAPEELEQLVSKLRRICTSRHFHQSDFYLRYCAPNGVLGQENGEEKQPGNETSKDTIEINVRGEDSDGKAIANLAHRAMMPHLGFNMMLDIFLNLAENEKPSCTAVLRASITGERNIANLTFSRAEFNDLAQEMLQWFEDCEAYEKCQLIVNLKKQFKSGDNPETPPAADPW